ncbi:MAG: hypothetical protein IKQ72_04690 [Bacteroidaceae bacterium]|nr:hypothetical protein [Bacteroidaceae bacterium]
MKTFKTFALAAMMTIFGTATTFAHRNPDMRNKNTHVTVVVDNHRHDRAVKPCRPDAFKHHRHLNRPVDRCTCKHCKKMHRKMAKMARKTHKVHHNHHRPMGRVTHG